MRLVADRKRRRQPRKGGSNMAKKKKKKPVVVKKFGKKKEKTSADRPVPRDKKKVPPTRRPVEDKPKKVEKVKAKPVKKVKPKAKPAKKVKPKAKPVKKAKPVAKPVKKPKTKKPVQKKRTKKEKVQVPPRLGWPPLGTVVDGKVRYIVPQPGDEPTVIKGFAQMPVKKHFAEGTAIPGDFTPTDRKGANQGVVVTFLKGVEGWPAHIRVTRNGELVTNLFNKSWKAALDQMRVNYGINLLIPKLM